MSQGLVGRRAVFLGAGAVAAGAVGAAVLPAAQASASAGGGVSGGWVITRHDKGAPSTVKSSITFADGGAFATTDLDPVAPANLGAWVDAGDNRFRAEFWVGPSAPTQPLIRVRPRGSWSGDRIEGTYSVAGFVAGKQVFATSGTFHGTRIEP